MIDITQITALPVTRQIEIVRSIVESDAWNAFSNVQTGSLDDALTALYKESIDADAYENDALHGQEVLPLAEPMWFRPGSVGL